VSSPASNVTPGPVAASTAGSTFVAAVAPHSIAYLYPITFFSGTILISLGPVLDPIIRDLDVPLAKGGLLATGYAAGRVVALLIFNLFLAKVPLKWQVVGAALLQAAALALPALVAHSLGPLVGALAVVGLAATIPVVVPVVWIGAYAKHSTERAMLKILIFFALGVVVAPLVIGAALALGAGWRWVFLGEAIFSAAVGLAVLALPLADVPGRENIRLRQLREAAVLDPRLLAMILGGMFLYIGSEHILNIWLAEFQVETFGASQGAAATALALFFGGMMVGRYLSVPLTRRLATPRILALSSASMAMFMVLTAFASTFAASEVFVFLAGLGASAAYPMLSSYINRFPAKFSGLVFSLITLAVIVSGAVFAYAAGPAGQALGMRAAVALAAVPAVAVLVLSFFLPKRALVLDGDKEPREV
jgi:FHS family L-fucose permease-like MFS transporter